MIICLAYVSSSSLNAELIRPMAIVGNATTFLKTKYKNVNVIVRPSGKYKVLLVN